MGNLVPAAVADPIGLGRYPLQRFIDFLQKPLIALTEPELKILITLDCGLIAEVWEGGGPHAMIDQFARSAQKQLALLLQV